MDYTFIEGTEPYIFYLHGWGGSKDSFLFMKNYFSNGKVFVTFDGFAQEKLEKPFCVQDFADHLLSLIKEITKGKIIIVCHSFGARVGAKICSQHPEIIDKLVIIDGAGLKPRRHLRYYLSLAKYKRLKNKVKKGKADASLLANYGSIDYKALSPIMKQTFVKVVNEDLKNDFKRIKCPTLIIWGKNDTETPLYMGRRLHKLIKGSSFCVIDEAGHFSYLDNLNMFLTLMMSFI